MRLAEGPRQMLAGLVSAAAFLGFYLKLMLVWWLSLVLAVLVYGAVLLIVRRKLRADEITAGAGVTQADLVEAGRIMDRAAVRLEATHPKLPDTDAQVVAQLAAHVRSIRAQIMSDPQDYRRARRFISSYLGNMVDTVERFAELTAKTRGQHEARLQPIAARIHAYLPALEKIDAACLENDFTALEAQMNALAYQMERG